MTRILLAALLAGSMSLPSCYQFQVTAQGGYTQMAIGGDMALAPTGGNIGATVTQDFESALGLGDDRGSPWARLQIDTGVPVLTASGFTFSEDGQGHLNASFGGISGGTDVFSELDFTNAKISYAFQIEIGPVSVSPGLAVDLFDLQMHVQDVAGFASEDVDVMAPVPMGFLRLEADLGLVGLWLEGGYIETPTIEEAKGTFWDVEAMLEVRATSALHLFAGYRVLNLEGEGEVDDQAFDAQIDISGWVIGGGVRF